MAAFQPLTDIHRIKTNLLASLGRRGSYEINVSYDEYVDAFTVLFTPNDKEWVVHYLDEHIGAVYLAESFELIGIYIEGVKHGFLQQHQALDRAWQNWERALQEDRPTAMLILRLVDEVIAAFHDRANNDAARLAAVLA